jgi:hypothetical protein
MKLNVIGLVIIMGLGMQGKAYSQPEKEVTRVIESLFKAMETGDSTLARSTFATDVTTATIYKGKDGATVLERESGINDFVKAIGTPHPQKWYEEIWNVKVQVDGDFAQLWCDYGFYVGNKFSHCGADAFHLYNDKGTWKIFHLADTRRKTPCDIPAEIQNKHK